jgi:hypothetical protein
MDKETLKAKCGEYVKVTKRWKELAEQGEQMATALRVVADGLRLPRNEKEVFQAEILLNQIASVPEVETMRSLIAEASQTFEHKRKLYESLWANDAPAQW